MFKFSNDELVTMFKNSINKCTVLCNKKEYAIYDFDTNSRRIYETIIQNDKKKNKIYLIHSYKDLISEIFLLINDKMEKYREYIYYNNKLEFIYTYNKGQFTGCINYLINQENLVTSIIKESFNKHLSSAKRHKKFNFQYANNEDGSINVCIQSDKDRGLVKLDTLGNILSYCQHGLYESNNNIKCNYEYNRDKLIKEICVINNDNTTKTSEIKYTYNYKGYKNINKITMLEKKINNNQISLYTEEYDYSFIYQ